jgi:hypothetical protein
MKTNSFAAVLFMLLVSFSGSPIPAQSSVDTFSWLAGCWSGSRDGREFSEQWMKPGGNSMFGTGRTIVKGKTAEYEFMQIRQDEAGSIVFIAKPSGQAEASFKLLSASEREITFENPAHDFPQKVNYRLQEDGSLVATIEGVINGKKKRIGFPMRRERCETGR